MSTLDIILSILIGICIIIPILIRLIKVLNESASKKEWKTIIELISKFCSEAEGLFDVGSEKKEYVVKMITSVADGVGLKLSDNDILYISNMIDALIEMTKKVNVSTSITAK